MRNLKIFTAYNGTNYHGWQRQANNITVQQVIEEKMSRIMDTPVTVHGCSRTDAGVHARRFCFSTQVDNPIPCAALMRAMNSMLPDDIAILSCEEADEDFHARFSAKGKEYVYLVNNMPYKDVFSGRLALFYPRSLDEQRLDSAAKLFVGEHDFAAFCKAEALRTLSSTVRTIYAFDVTRNGGEVTFTVSGNGFLHNMVRIMVGTLLYINENKRGENETASLLSGGNRSMAGVTVPPWGLYLNRVFYE